MTGEPPEAIARLAETVAAAIGVTVADLTVRDHTHEELSPGAYSIAYEGDYDWPFRFTEAVYAGRESVPDGWTLEAGTGWYLAAYPEQEENA